jgi:hypothetical protein
MDSFLQVYEVDSWTVKVLNVAYGMITICTEFTMYCSCGRHDGYLSVSIRLHEFTQTQTKFATSVKNSSRTFPKQGMRVSKGMCDSEVRELARRVATKYYNPVITHILEFASVRTPDPNNEQQISTDATHM